MVQGLFFILKVIGWIILGVLGLILGILLFALFSAVRYRIKGKKDDKPEGQIRITWLLRIVSVTVKYQDNLSIQAKLFGKTIWKLDNSKEETDEDGPEEELSEGMPDWSEQEAPQNAADDHATGRKKQKKPEKKKRAEIEQLEEQLSCLQAEKEKAENKDSENEYSAAETWRERVKAKIIALIEKLRFSFAQFCGKLKQIEEKRQLLEEKWTWLCGKWDKLSSMVQDPENHKSVRLILRQLKKIIKHVLPRKGTASVTFGREDPYTMGRMLSGAAVLYPFTHKFLTLHPVFDRNQLEGEADIRGRVRLGVILGYILRLLFNKNIRKQLFGLLRPKKNKK